MKTLLALLFAIGFLSAGRTPAADLALTWDAAPAEELVTSYKVYSLIAALPGGNAQRHLLGSTTTTSFPLEVVDDKALWLIVTALNLRAESAPSSVALLPRVPTAPAGVRFTVILQRAAPAPAAVR